MELDNLEEEQLKEDDILVIVASLNKESINREIYKQFEPELSSKDKNINEVDLGYLFYLPYIFNDYEIPFDIEILYNEIAYFKNIIIFTPEHNGYFSAFFKNVLDWLSRVDREFLKDKKVFVISVSETQRDTRTMEVGVKNTMAQFGDPNLTFINFNKYEKGKDESQRIKDITKQIFSNLI